ncbi:related to cop9 complex subunit 3 [Melanopsichium pennsylvanicum]|uniref:COP9 signalosome complex subunit 3 n=2 Tax=Melanopsichium pennsylvanicum TaxID=63383 RepID=A0AAJ4XGZ2_9BASI|nr:related to cop9 complex subunit 3 [Melanopsichium pennsylvanicum 4]SNX82295.1 related to cop9 complex subunit 3 [Melanopsichium pennsylvanicum]
MTVTILSNIEEALSLILDCGSDLARIQSTLLPALRKLTSSASSSEPTTSRSTTQASETLLCHPIQGNVDSLTPLNPTTHALGMLYILSARATHNSSTPEHAASLMPHITAWVHSFDQDQAWLAGDKVVQLASCLSGLGDTLGDAQSSLQLLQGLASRFLVHSQSITSLHPILAYQYLKTQRYAEAATMLLDLPLIDTDTSVTPLTHSDALQYFYYAGLIYIKLERLADAIDSFETQCISAPAVAASAIHMDAYKKLVLTQLLAHGQTTPVPKYTPQVVTRTFKQLAQPYLAFITAYESRDSKSAEAVLRAVEEKKDAFDKDRNLGLVRRCVALHRQRRIQRLGQVYSALTLKNIAERVDAGQDFEAVQQDVAEVVRKGWIQASLIPPSNSTSEKGPSADWVIAFDTFGGDAYTSTACISLLEDKIRTAKEWQTLLVKRDRDVEASQAYLTRGLKMKDARTAADAYGGGADDFDETEY